MLNALEKNVILIVDDESFNLDLLEIALEELENIETVRASNGNEALEKVQQSGIDLIILDISMPELDGLEVLKILKSDLSTKFIPVIVATAKSEERYKALELGSEDFLSKPIDVIELKFRVGNLLKLKKFNDLQQFFNIRLEEEITKKEKQLKKFLQVEQELSLAREIQQSIFPKTFPEGNDLDVYGVCTQASEVGGDYFDTFQTDCGKFTVFIMADVSGHGFASALISMQFRTLVHAELMKNRHSLKESVERINTIFSKDNEESSMFITALFMRYSHETGTMESVNAGHYDPYGTVEMKHASGIPLGIQEGMPYESIETPFPSGSTIILYTDGIVEGSDSKGEMFGDRFYREFDKVKPLTPSELNNQLLRTYYNFIEVQDDDVTLLVIKAK